MVNEKCHKTSMGCLFYMESNQLCQNGIAQKQEAEKVGTIEWFSERGRCHEMPRKMPGGTDAIPDLEQRQREAIILPFSNINGPWVGHASQDC
jgi:hypothetical protein